MATETTTTMDEIETSGVGTATGAILGGMVGTMAGSIGTVFGAVVGGTTGAAVGASIGAAGDLAGKTVEEVAIFSWDLFKSVFGIEDKQGAEQGSKPAASGTAKK